MILLRFLFFLSSMFVFALGCAKPNYQDTSNTPTNSQDDYKPSSPIDTNPSEPSQPTNTSPAEPSQPANEKPQENICQVFLSKAQICLHIKWIQKPNSQTQASFLLSFTHGKTNQPIPLDVFQNLAQNLKIILWMPSMGHGSVPVIIKKNSDSSFLTVERVYFIMPGDWEIRFQLKENENIVDETSIQLFI